MSKAFLFRWRSELMSPFGPPATRRYVLLALSTHGDKNGKNIWPSTRTLADETGLSERAVCTHLMKADAEGWISRRVRGADRGRAWKSYEYQLLIPQKVLNEVQQQDTECDSEGTEHDACGTEPYAEGTEPDDTEALNDVQSISSVTSSKNSSENSYSASRAELKPEFGSPEWLTEKATQYVPRGVSGIREFHELFDAHPSERRRQAIREALSRVQTPEGVVSP